MSGRRLLVLFNATSSQESAAWWRQFDHVIAPESLRGQVESHGLDFIPLEPLVGPGSIEEAERLVRRLSLITTPDGRRVSKSVVYRGYELWWMHYDDLFYYFCLPYTQFRALLEHLREYDDVCLYQPPAAGLFEHYCHAHRLHYRVIDHTRTMSLGLLLQAALSVPFALWLMVRRPKLMVWTSDQFDGPRDHDFRMRFIYEELRRKRIRFVEFIRSMERTPVALRHALVRKRAVVYSFALVSLTRWVAGLVSAPPRTTLPQDPEESLWLCVAEHYLTGVQGDIWAIRVLMLVLRLVGVRAAIIDAAVGRNFCEVIACKLLSIPTVGILHGFASKDYNVYDFMPEFDGEKTLSVDIYGVWSEWWREYYLRHGRAYRPEQLVVSGPMRPPIAALPSAEPVHNPLRVLFVSEQLGVHQETLPYLLALLDAPNLEVHLSVRPYGDGFERWLTEHRPDVLERVSQQTLFRGNLNEGLLYCDVAAGSHSTGVIESLLYEKPPVFFKSKKWGDYFELKSLTGGERFLADDPAGFVERIRASAAIPKQELRDLQQRFFGDPHQNGSAWVVAQVETLL